jgi:two-component system, cell cycle sensor histidine kinase and response regulator CckA
VAFEAEHLNRNGTPHYFDFSVKPVTDDAGKVIMLIPEGRDITARKQAEERIKQQADFFQRLIDSMPYPVFYKDRQGLYLSCNRAFEKFYGVRRDQITGKTVYAVAPKERAERHTRIDKELLSQSGSRVYEARVQSDDGANHDVIFHKATFQTQQGEVARNYRIVSSPICNAAGQVLSAIELVEDITEKHFLESQVRQAQKMEAVGRLAGGVAHDFNNMLSVILGYAELALYKLEASHPVHAKLVQIRDAAQRSTDIIQQLLAFARKQTIAPQMLDLNEAVEGVLKMLRRLIGEDIDLVWRSDSGLWPVKMDPTQIEQILANLCVNARDAIQGIGKITIETSNVNFDEAYCQDHAGFQPGRYVMLAVSDDGCGMDPDTLEKIFEPFFTTKGVGRGTGLGLSTVYGIVKQNDGFINVYSEKDRGTTFKIYFAGHQGPITELIMEDSEELIPGQGETVLVVEDEDAVLEMTHSMLEGLGYAVMSAGSPEAALLKAEAYDGEIHLLVTDVIMPGMNGKDVAEKIRKNRPDMKLLFMSGYTANVIAHRSMLDPGVQFISKPFTVQQLSAKVRKVLERTV